MKVKKKLRIKKPKFRKVGFITIIIFLMDLLVIAGLVVINTNKFKSIQNSPISYKNKTYINKKG